MFLALTFHLACLAGDSNPCDKSFNPDALELDQGAPLQINRDKKLKRIRFFIWTKDTPFQPESKEFVTIDGKKTPTLGAEVIDPLMGVQSKVFNRTRKTLFAAHGMNAEIPGGGIGPFMLAHKERGDFDDYNFIGLDWRYLAKMQLLDSELHKNATELGLPGSDGYGPPAENTYFTGIKAANMLLALMEYPNKSATEEDRERIANVHIIGHSLGAHVAGNMARTLEKYTGRKVKHITALEPAAPKFVDDKCERIALRTTDAEYIDSVHTDGGINKPFAIRGLLGNNRPNWAHANFYMNGASHQPGCKTHDFGVCSHLRAFFHYAETMANSKALRGFRCTLEPGPNGSWSKPAAKGCLETEISNKEESAYLMEDYEESSRPMGSYAIRTTSQKPTNGPFEPFSDPDWNNQ